MIFERVSNIETETDFEQSEKMCDSSLKFTAFDIYNREFLTYCLMYKMLRRHYNAQI